MPATRYASSATRGPMTVNLLHIFPAAATINKVFPYTELCMHTMTLGFCVWINQEKAYKLHFQDDIMSSAVKEQERKARNV